MRSLTACVFLLALLPGCSTSSQKTDAGLEDAGTDATDAGLDAADLDDGGDGDGGQEQPWAWCPSASDYVGGDWPNILRVTPEATYCVTFDEGRELEEERPVKARLRIVPGDYPVPDSDGEYEFLLPLCLEFLEPGTHPAHDGVGTIKVRYDEYPPDRYYNLDFSMPMVTASGQSWEFQAYLSGKILPGDALGVIEGAYTDPWEGPYFDFAICSECENHRTHRFFASCHFDTARPQRYTVTYQGGEVELYMQMGESGDSTEPAAFVRAIGTLDGSSFEQTDYYRLIYNPEHHHFEADFAVLFDQNMAGACGLKVQDIDPWQDPPAARMTTLECDLSEIEERVVTNVEFEWL